MSGLKVWITAILAVVIVGVVADLLLTGNRMHKFIRGIFGIITLFVIAAPLPTLIKSGFDFKFDWGGSISVEQGFLDAISAKQIKVIEQSTEKMLTDQGCSGVKIAITGKVKDNQINIERLVANISNVVINNGNKNIDIREFVADKIVQALDIDKSIIAIIE